MTSLPTNNFRMTINSKHFSNRIDADIIQLTKTISIEYSVPIEEAKVMARKMVQNKLNSILTIEEKEGIDKLAHNTTNMVQKSFGKHGYAKTVYELLKTMELL